MPRPRRLFALVALLAAAPSCLRAWGSATHQWITNEALKRVADDPAVALLAQDPRLRQALLGGAVAPDIMLALTPTKQQSLASKGHWIFKDLAIAEDLVASARTGEEWASALGFLCHHLQDEEGDHEQGYPTRKSSVLYKDPTFNEVMLDLLVLAEPDPPTASVAVDVRRLAAATRRAGRPLTVQDLRRARRAFAWLRALLRGFLRAVIEVRGPDFMETIGAHYADARAGLHGEPGIEALVLRTSELIRRRARARPAWIAHLRGQGNDLVEPEPPGIEQMAFEAFRWGEPLARETNLVELFHFLVENNWTRSYYVLQYLAGLWVTTEPDFASYRDKVSHRASAGLGRRTKNIRARRARARERARSSARAPAP